ATRSKRLIGGKTLGMIRTAFRQMTRRIGIGASADGVSETTSGPLSREISTTFSIQVRADEKQPGNTAEHELERRTPFEEGRLVREPPWISPSAVEGNIVANGTETQRRSQMVCDEGQALRLARGLSAVKNVQSRMEAWTNRSYEPSAAQSSSMETCSSSRCAT